MPDEKNTKFEFIKSLIIKILYIVIVPVIIYDLFLIIQTIINPDVTPNIFGVKTFSIISGSMTPTININDIILVKDYDMTKLETNDIITFRMDDETITHRIIAIQRIGQEIVYTTKGDNNDVSDIEKVKYDQVEGKYIGRIPNVGKILSFLKNKKVFGAIIIILIICYFWEKRGVEKKIERREKRRKFELDKIK